MVLVFDLGGTNTRLALSDDGELHEVIRLPTDNSAAGFAKFLGAIEEFVKGKKISAIAGGIPGQVRGEDGELVIATNLKDWLGQPVAGRLKEITDCPVVIANDMEMCGLGESHHGAGTVEGVMVYYTVSTGVNGVRIVDGHVDATIARYEMGHQIINFAGGKPESLEQLSGGAALQKRLGIAPREVKDDTVWRGIERYLGAGLYNTVLYWNPVRVVLGGSMLRDVKVARVAEELGLMSPVYDEWPELVTAKLGDQAGLYGALVKLSQLGYK